MGTRREITKKCGRPNALTCRWSLTHGSLRGPVSAAIHPRRSGERENCYSKDQPRHRVEKLAAARHTRGRDALPPRFFQATQSTGRLTPASSPGRSHFQFLRAAATIAIAKTGSPTVISDMPKKAMTLPATSQASMLHMPPGRRARLLIQRP